MDSDLQITGLPSSDVSIATLWTTAYTSLHYQKVRRKFYFVQDYEPLFYPAGSTSALVEATYGFGLLGICNTVSLRDLYVARGGAGEYFDPCIDPTVFHSNGRASGDRKPHLLFCYGRPGHPRNGFELLASAMKILKLRMQDDVVIVTAGAEWDVRTYGLEGVVQNLGLLGYTTTGALYRACDAGAVLMMTCHPSYLPLELMACGSLVITNRNPHTNWLLRDEENCLLAAASPSSFAERIEEGLRNVKLRKKVAQTAQDLVNRKYSTWDTEAEKVIRYIRSQS
jgi:glycosyltransferase involved in cell wall biosynthesis